MNRVQGVCRGDCGTCELLARGEVDMVPCAIDQIFRIVRDNQREIRELRTAVASINKTRFTGVSINPINPENNGTHVQEDA